MFYRVFKDAVFKEPIVNKYWVGKFNDLKEECVWGNMRGGVWKQSRNVWSILYKT